MLKIGQVKTERGGQMLETHQRWPAEQTVAKLAGEML